MSKLVAILPKNKFLKSSNTRRTNIQAALDDLADDLIFTMQYYPPKQPWKIGTRVKGPEGRTGPNRRVVNLGYLKSGPRKGGRRTYKYRRGWRKVKKPYSIEVINKVKYAVWVGGSRRSRGPKQTNEMRRRGWLSTSDVGPKVRAFHRAAFQKALGARTK